MKATKHLYKVLEHKEATKLSKKLVKNGIHHSRVIIGQQWVFKITARTLQLLDKEDREGFDNFGKLSLYCGDIKNRAIVKDTWNRVSLARLKKSWVSTDKRADFYKKAAGMLVAALEAKIKTSSPINKEVDDVIGHFKTKWVNIPSIDEMAARLKQLEIDGFDVSIEETEPSVSIKSPPIIQKTDDKKKASSIILDSVCIGRLTLKFHLSKIAKDKRGCVYEGHWTNSRYVEHGLSIDPFDTPEVTSLTENNMGALSTSKICLGSTKMITCPAFWSMDLETLINAYIDFGIGYSSTVDYKATSVGLKRGFIQSRLRISHRYTEAKVMLEQEPEVREAYAHYNTGDRRLITKENSPLHKVANISIGVYEGRLKPKADPPKEAQPAVPDKELLKEAEYNPEVCILGIPAHIPQVVRDKIRGALINAAKEMKIDYKIDAIEDLPKPIRKVIKAKVVFIEEGGKPVRKKLVVENGVFKIVKDNQAKE